MLTDRAARTPTAQRRATPKERRTAGRARREAVPLESHGEFSRPSGARGAVSLLEEQSADRLPELAPVRYGRMLRTDFTFFRGAARVMAADLAGTARSGLAVQMCGDAHLSNFGFYGSPERRLVFDANDFDETLPGPFEFDVKRLVASLVVAGRENGLSRKRRRVVAIAAGRRYREAMAEFAAARDLEVWYSHLDADSMLKQLDSHLDADSMLKQLDSRLDSTRRKRLAQALAKTRTRDTLQAFGKLTEVVDGRLRLRAEPPLIVPLRDLLPGTEGHDLTAAFSELIAEYAGTLPVDHRTLLDRYTFVDMARKVVGVGSVGTRCWVVLLLGRDEEDPLLLQVKEAPPSVHAEFVGASAYAHEGERVVSGQRLMQQSSDIFLGWQRTAGIDGVERDFYVRQLRDWKGSLTVEELRPEGLEIYGQVCAWSLARAHARSGDRIAIAGYLGSSPAFEEAVADFAETYADVTAADHRLLAAAAAAGSVPVAAG